MSRWDDARDDARPAEPRQTGHRREVDPRRQPRQSFSERKELALTDVAVYRTVAVRDLAAARFGGHPFTTRKAINSMVKSGWMQEHTAKGPKGRAFKVLTVTPDGAKRGKEIAAKYGLSKQATWSGLVKRSELRHELAVYRSAQVEKDKLEAQGFAVERVRIDAEMKRGYRSRHGHPRRSDGAAASGPAAGSPDAGGEHSRSGCPAGIPGPGWTTRPRQRRGGLRALLRGVDCRQRSSGFLHPLRRKRRKRQRRQDRRQDRIRPWKRRWIGLSGRWRERRRQI